jgi:hypothetical protein
MPTLVYICLAAPLAGRSSSIHFDSCSGGRYSCLGPFGGGQAAAMRGAIRALSGDAHEFAHIACMAFADELRLAKLATFARGPGAHQVGSEAVMAFHFARFGNLESLGNALTGLVLVTHHHVLERKHRSNWSGGAGILAVSGERVKAVTSSIATINMAINKRETSPGINIGKVSRFFWKIQAKTYYCPTG